MNLVQSQNNWLLDLQSVGFYYWQKTNVFSRNKFWVLKNITTKVYQGETLGIIGRNGVGKSTLLRLLAGIVKPDSGHIKRNCARVSLLALQAGFNPHLTGRENALFAGMLFGVSKSEMLKRMDDILEFSELGDFFEQPIKTYSTGMRARLGFATALQASPELFLVDEVIGVGDAVFREKSVEAMKAKICSDQTVVLVSHNLPLIDEVCQRVLWIENGQALACGETRQVLEKYVHYIKELQDKKVIQKSTLAKNQNIFNPVEKKIFGP